MERSWSGEALEGAAPVSRLTPPQAQPLEDAAGGGAHRRLVVDQEHGAATNVSAGSAGRTRRLLLGPRTGAGHVQSDLRSAPWPAVDLHASSVRTCSPVDHGESQPAALAGRLGREERVEGEASSLRIHPRTRAVPG